MVKHKRSTKVICVKGKKQVGALERKHLAQELMDGAHAGSIGDFHPFGWIQTRLFTKWFQHFINFTKPSKYDHIIFILGAHHNCTKETLM